MSHPSPTALEASSGCFVNPTLPWTALKDRYARHGRILVKEFLCVSAAQALSAIAKSPLPWILHYRNDGESRRLLETDLLARGASERDAIFARVLEIGRHDFQFSYFGCSLAPRDIEHLHPEHPVRSLAAKLITHDFVSLLAECVGDTSIRGLTASLTRYDPGQFLLPHDDTDTTDDRRAAFVLNLSEDWWPDWGGLLQFLDEDRNVVETFSPHNGALALFKVPQLHAVSFVTPFALRSRYSITGWLIG